MLSHRAKYLVLTVIALTESLGDWVRLGLNVQSSDYETNGYPSHQL